MTSTSANNFFFLNVWTRALFFIHDHSASFCRSAAKTMKPGWQLEALAQALRREGGVLPHWPIECLFVERCAVTSDPCDVTLLVCKSLAVCEDPVCTVNTHTHRYSPSDTAVLLQSFSELLELLKRLQCADVNRTPRGLVRSPGPEQGWMWQRWYRSPLLNLH